MNTKIYLFFNIKATGPLKSCKGDCKEEINVTGKVKRQIQLVKFVLKSPLQNVYQGQTNS